MLLECFSHPCPLNSAYFCYSAFKPSSAISTSLLPQLVLTPQHSLRTESGLYLWAYHCSHPVHFTSPKIFIAAPWSLRSCRTDIQRAPLALNSKLVEPLVSRGGLIRLLFSVNYFKSKCWLLETRRFIYFRKVMDNFTGVHQRITLYIPKWPCWVLT